VIAIARASQSSYGLGVGHEPQSGFLPFGDALGDHVTKERAVSFENVPVGPSASISASVLAHGQPVRRCAPEVVEVRRGEARARGVDLDAGRFEFGGTNEGAGSRLATTLDTSAIEHLITAGPAHSDRGDGWDTAVPLRDAGRLTTLPGHLGRRWRHGLALVRRAKGERDASNDAYLDYSGRDDALSGGSRMIPVDTPAERGGSGPSGSEQLRPQAAPAPRGPDAPMSTSKPSTVTFQQRASSITTTTNSDRASVTNPSSRRCGSSTASSTRLSRSARHSVSSETTSSLRPVVGWHSRYGVRPSLPRAPARTGHLQHDVERAGLQRLCAACAHAEMDQARWLRSRRSKRLATSRTLAIPTC